MCRSQHSGNVKDEGYKYISVVFSDSKERSIVKETFLRGDKLESYLPMGENGQAVHLSALQLRETLRLRQLSEVANSLAIPQVNEQGDHIDWYAGFPGNVVPWSAATDDERQAALRQLEANQAAIEQLSTQMVNQKAHEMRLFGALLSKTVQFPDQDHLYLVDGKPVVTFWGFVNAKQQARPNPLDCLRSSRPVAPSVVSDRVSDRVSDTALNAPSKPVVEPAVSAEPKSSPAPEPGPQRRRLPGWLWLLLPLLLILLALLLLRGCVPEIPIWGITSSTDSTPLHRNEVTLKEEEGTSSRLASDKPVSDNRVNDKHSLHPVNGVVALNGAINRDGVINRDNPQPLNAPIELETQEPPTPMPSQPEINLPPVSVDPSSSADLSIPATALQQNRVDFLNGRWHAGAGIQDSRTGKPLSLTYQIHDGKGEIEMRRGDGIRCQAPIRAVMNSEKLQLDSRGEAKCTDGSTYTMPDVICQPGKQGVAECKGRYDEKTLFPMSIKREAN
ncbi:virulence effector protein [Xenorhabdus beddingii]|uniref:Virulence effector protein n=1 Tax=Xenorhabdus beddingii TaxID=40578 RepID=A0A1Y2SQ72_9GAMM|nr:SrfA family protein [Xenorhabdus beddingii]OTA20374.1 virulence effector protein [Xenorhabdus beddingii]